jgi:preprotein translocase subunit SecA
LQAPDGSEPDYNGLLQWVNTTFPLGLNQTSAAFETRTAEENSQFLVDRIKQSYQRKVSHEESEAVAGLERYIILNAIDRLWQEHLYAMDGLREGIYLRSYGQKDPLVEYKAEAYDMFSQLMASIKNEVLSNLFRSTTNLMAFEQFLSSLPFNIVQRPEGAPPAGMPSGPLPRRENLGLAHGNQNDNNGEELELVIPTVRREAPKVGRNDPCPCGSGKKYKNCCGRLA